MKVYTVMIVCSAFALALVSGCEPEPPMTHEPTFLPTPEQVILERRAPDGALFDVVIRFDTLGAEKLEEIVSSLAIVDRAAVVEEIDAIKPADAGRFDLPAELGAVPAFAIELRSKSDEVDVRNYAFRVGVELTLDADESGGGAGAAPAQGIAMLACKGGLMTSSSLPLVHLMGIVTTSDEVSEVRLNTRVESVGFIGRSSSTHRALVANAFHDEPVPVFLEYTCVR